MEQTGNARWRWRWSKHDCSIQLPEIERLCEVTCVCGPLGGTVDDVAQEDARELG